jgi:hypothetical protein
VLPASPSAHFPLASTPRNATPTGYVPPGARGDTLSFSTSARRRLIGQRPICATQSSSIISIAPLKSVPAQGSKGYCCLCPFGKILAAWDEATGVPLVVVMLLSTGVNYRCGTHRDP